MTRPLAGLTKESLATLAKLVKQGKAPQLALTAAETIGDGPLEVLKQKAREGDPIPYIAYQWPHVILDEFQVDVLKTLMSHDVRELYIKGNTSCGKGGSVGIGVCTYFSVWDDAKVVITSDSYSHATRVMYAEVLKWGRSMKFPPKKVEWLNARVDGGESHWIRIVNPETGEGFSGIHGLHVLFVFDEASAIAEERYKLANTQCNKFVALSNPRILSGAFYEAFPRANPDENQTFVGPFGKRRCITVGGHDCMNVRQKRLEHPIAPIGGIEIEGVQYDQGDEIPKSIYDAHCKPIIPGQVCYDTYMGIISDPSEFYRDVFGHGKFPKEDPDIQLILPSWLPKHIEYFDECHKSPSTLDETLPVEAFGLDVAGTASGDLSVLAAGGARGVRGLHLKAENDTMALIGWILELTKSQYGIDLTRGNHKVCVDFDGLGKPIGQRMQELGVMIVEVYGNASVETDKAKYGNKRAEVYGLLAERLDAHGKYQDEPWAIPNDQMLKEELIRPEKIMKGSEPGKYWLTPKRRYPGMNYKGSTLNEQLGRSPDRADAVALLHFVTVGLHTWVSAQFDPSSFNFEVDSSWVQRALGQ